MLIAILSQTPWWVFILFAYVLFIGIKALSTRTLPASKLAVAPAIFAVWGVFALSGMLGPNMEGWLTFCISLIVGGLAGWGLAKIGRAQRLPDQQIELQGSPITLILVLLIFGSKYALGYWQAVDPGAAGTPAFLFADAGVTGVVIGMFVGRFLGILSRCRALPDHIANA